MPKTSVALLTMTIYAKIDLSGVDSGESIDMGIEYSMVPDEVFKDTTKEIITVLKRVVKFSKTEIELLSKNPDLKS